MANDTASTIDRLAENSFLKVIGRGGMALAVPFLLWFGTYLASQSSAIADVATITQNVKDDLTAQVSKASARIDVIDARAVVVGRTRDQFQDNITAALADVARQNSSILQQQASILASLTALQKQVDKATNN